MLRHLGPGLIISAMIVGSGELIVTPKLGATAGFSLLWFIVLGCLLKVFVQVELGRFAVAERVTTLEAMNLMPGPRWIVSWIVWIWLGMYLSLVFQVAGMVGGLARVIALAGVPIGTTGAVLLVSISCLALLLLGRYRLVERVSALFVVIFTLCTLVAVGMLQSTPMAITGAQLAEGFSGRLPGSFTMAFAAFGIIGVGASELIYYPYWCLEKGYGRNVGTRDGCDFGAWVERARGWIRVMRLDAWFSFALYTTATAAFYLLGAAVLHAQGLEVENHRMVETLSQMYRETFGQWSYWLFLLGAFAVLYSTVFGATASNARLFADALSVFGMVRYPSSQARSRMVQVGCGVLILAITVVCLAWGEAPVSLVLVGAVAQALMLPFLAAAALFLRFRKTLVELRPGRVWTGALITAALAMAAAGTYELIGQIRKLVVGS